MQEKIEQSNPPALVPTAPAVPTSPERREESSSVLKMGMNLGLTMLAVNTGVTVSTLPIRIMLKDHLRSGQFISPDWRSMGGLFYFYRGLVPHFSGGMIKSSFAVASSKEATREKVGTLEEKHTVEANRVKIDPRLFTLSMAFSECVITHPFGNYTHIKQNKNIIHPINLWSPNNILQLEKNGFGIKLGMTTISLYGICQGADAVKASLPIKNDFLAEVAAGSITGFGTALSTYPLTVTLHHLTDGASVTPQGDLNVMKFSALAKKGIAAVKANPIEEISHFASKAQKQLPSRVAMSMTVNMMVRGIPNVLGSNPSGFFFSAEGSEKPSRLAISKDEVASLSC